MAAQEYTYVEAGPDCPASPNIRNNRPGLERGAGGGSFLSAGEEDRGGGDTGHRASEHYQGRHQTRSATGQTIGGPRLHPRVHVSM